MALEACENLQQKLQNYIRITYLQTYNHLAVVNLGHLRKVENLQKHQQILAYTLKHFQQGRGAFIYHIQFSDTFRKAENKAAQRVGRHYKPSRRHFVQSIGQIAQF